MTMLKKAVNATLDVANVIMGTPMSVTGAKGQVEEAVKSLLITLKEQRQNGCRLKINGHHYPPNKEE